jgi:hypothetical protein
VCLGCGQADSNVNFPISHSACMHRCVLFLTAGISIARSFGHVKDAYWNPDTSSFVSSLFLP